VLARRLIWTFTDHVGTISAAFLSGTLVDYTDEPITVSEADTIVRLWHPIDHLEQEISSWHRWLERHQIRQPFKQAHREVYLLDDAECQSKTYSNRFAAHIVKQHQFNALCSARGWRNVLKLLMDQEFPPAARLLPKWGLRAEFWTDGVGEDYAVDTNQSGVFLYLTTDQIRFLPIDAPQSTGHPFCGMGQVSTVTPIPLRKVDPLVFSEVMRDIDLFISVSSVGNDLQWSDSGPQGRYYEYWKSYMFKELSPSAKMRRLVLTQLLPKLRISDRCTIEDNFLVVRGDLRPYKIHIGTGNILVPPDNQAFDRALDRKAQLKKGEELFVPFEGDEVLARIVGRAYLLVEDTCIRSSWIGCECKTLTALG